ncbi:MAG: cobalamin B12-binding domain-containing protein, partial [Nitrososphaeraceae archaeon]|nr:cobalamin B12-binding domain-containing protein [Nitrososphaeraceae archaeon]
YIRSKKVKGIDYAYLVQSIWDHKNNTSKQHIIKYLGKTSNVTIEDIPKEYRNDPKIITFISIHGSSSADKEKLVAKIQEEIFALLIECNLGHLIKIYDKYLSLFGLANFYDKLLKPVMYKIGELWEQEKLDVATEHACTNTASSLVKVINERISHSKATRSQYKILICTPEGELHSLACNIIESLLLSKGFKVYNISPSVPSDSIIDYLKDIEPDIMLISITITDNIKPAERLIKEIRLKYHIVPIIIGGSGLNKVDDYITNDNDVIFMPNISFGEIIKLIYNISVKKQIGNNQLPNFPIY